MYTVTTNVVIPLAINNIDADSAFDAAEKTRKLIESGLPLIVNREWENIKNQMVIELKDISEEENEFEN